MIAKSTSARILLTGAIKAQTIAQLKNVAAMLTNPYVLAAAHSQDLDMPFTDAQLRKTSQRRL